MRGFRSQMREIGSQRTMRGDKFLVMDIEVTN